MIRSHILSFFVIFLISMACQQKADNSENTTEESDKVGSSLTTTSTEETNVNQVSEEYIIQSNGVLGFSIGKKIDAESGNLKKVTQKKHLHPSNQLNCKRTS